MGFLSYKGLFFNFMIRKQMVTQDWLVSHEVWVDGDRTAVWGGVWLAWCAGPWEVGQGGTEAGWGGWGKEVH